MRKGPANSACRLGQHQHIIPRQQWRVHARRDVGSHGPRVQAGVVSTLLAMYSPAPEAAEVAVDYPMDLVAVNVIWQ